jgi:hypothetical protein
MRKMRTLLQASILTGALALGLAACGGGSNSNGSAGGAVVAAYAVKSWANVTIASGDQQVTLLWDDTNVATGSTATASTAQVTYNVYYSLNPGVKKGGSGVTKVANGSSTTFIHSGLTNGTPYYYVVTPVSADGSEGVESREASATPQAAIPPVPTGISIAAGDGQITLGTGFTPVAGVTYNVYWSTSAGVTKGNGNEIPAVTFPLTHPSLVPGTTYYYVVTAQTASGESAESKQLSATLLTTATAAATATNCGAPLLPSAQAANQQATIKWSDAALPTGTLTGTQTGTRSYTLYWWTAANPTKTAIKKVTSGYTQLSLVNGTTYDYYISAVYTVTDSGAVVGTPTETPSATVSVIPEAKAPATPAGLAAAAQAQQVQLSWKKDSSGDSVTYNLYWSSDLTKPWNKISNISSNAFSHTGLSAGLTYYYKVSAQGAAESASSNQVSATP